MKLKWGVFFFLFMISLTWAGAFDDRYPSARATAMSNAYVAIANDVWASYYNPAGLAQLNNYAAGFTYQRLFNLSFFKNVFFSAAMPLPGSFGGLSVTFENFGVEYEGEWMSSEYTAKLSHGFYLLNDIHSSLSIGYNLNYFHWKLGQSIEGLQLGSASTFGLDVGIQASIYHRTYLGVFVYNLNAPSFGIDLQRELPQRIVAGAAYRPLSGLVTTLVMEKTIGTDIIVEGGFEYYPVDFFSLRMGASTMPNRISVGFGLNYAGFVIDYAFRNHPVLAETHQFGISYNFGGK